MRRNGLASVGAALRVLATLIALGVSAPATAAADELRFPETGPIAFILNLPAGWVTQAVSGNMLVLAADRSAVLSLAVVPEDAESSKMTADQFANGALAVAKAEPFNKHERGTIAGFPADTYYSQMVNPSNLKLQVKMNIIKSVQNYVVSETLLMTPNMSAAQQAALDSVVNSITLTGVK